MLWSCKNYTHNELSMATLISRDGPDTPNTLQKPKNLRASNIVKLKTYIIIIFSKFSIYQYQEHACKTVVHVRTRF